jgi:hypothetical protein
MIQPSRSSRQASPIGVHQSRDTPPPCVRQYLCRVTNNLFDTHHVAFSAEGNAINDAFAYIQPVEQIRSTEPSSSELTITIDRLREIASLVPATNTVLLEVTPHHLTYRAEHPISGANLTVYNAEYLGAIRE